jgi:heme oxygenase (biliverdin-producing, ferredoxin)
MTLTQTIRAAIAQLHEAIEQTPFSVALMRGQLDAESYCTSLTQMWHIHAALERAALKPEIARFLSNEMVRTPAIERDLAHWSYPLRGADVFQATKDTVTKMAELTERQPLALLAHVYVLEGSRMGSMIIAKPLASSLGVLPIEGRGLDYHTEDMRQTPARFGAFKGRIDAAIAEAEQISLIADTAVDFMRSLNSIYQLLPTISGNVATREHMDVA